MIKNSFHENNITFGKGSTRFVGHLDFTDVHKASDTFVIVLMHTTAWDANFRRGSTCCVGILTWYLEL